jgi:MtN3 and saliva related transmembrane protein
MNNIEIIGFTAGIFLAVSLVPQIIKSWKTRSTKDISLIWSLINLIGEILWIVYGFYLNSYSLIIMSSISFLMNIFMMSLKIKFG